MSPQIPVRLVKLVRERAGDVWMSGLIILHSRQLGGFAVELQPGEQLLRRWE